MEIWHNPRCSKSRQACELIDLAGADVRQRRYLDDPPTAAELERVLDALGMQPWELARLGEPMARELGLRDWPRDRARWVAAMVAHPILIERPILVTDDGRAVLGRPPEAITGFLRS
jgi:arsenate reductase